MTHVKSGLIFHVLGDKVYIDGQDNTKVEYFRTVEDYPYPSSSGTCSTKVRYQMFDKFVDEWMRKNYVSAEQKSEQIMRYLNGDVPCK